MVNYRTPLARQPSSEFTELEAGAWDCSLAMMFIIKDLGAPIAVFDARKPEEFTLRIEGDMVRPQHGDVVVKHANSRFEIVPWANLPTLFNWVV